MRKHSAQRAEGERRSGRAAARAPRANKSIFHHVVLFRWKPETSAEQLAALERALAALPGQIRELRAYRFGADAKEAAGNFDFAISADFDDVEAWRAYVIHPAHQRLVAEHLRPLVAERAAVQFQSPR